jgi:secreted effector protein SseF
MGDITQVAFASPTLRGLDLVSSAKALPKTLVDFDPQTVPLGKMVEDKVADMQTKAQQTRDEAKLAADEAKKLGVDLAKSGFLNKLASVAFAGIAVGVSIAATVLTGGAGLPLLIASGVAFTLAVADAGCAFADWRSKANGGDGLAMGGDSIANAVNALLSKMGLNADSALWWGKAVSITSRVALAVGTLWSAVISPPSLPGHIASTVNLVNMASRSVQPLVQGLSDVSEAASTHKQQKLTAGSQDKALAAEVSTVKAHQLQRLQTHAMLQQADNKLNAAQSALTESRTYGETARFDAQMRTLQSQQRQEGQQALQAQLAQKDNLLAQRQDQLDQLGSRFSQSNAQLTGVMQQLQMLQQQLAELQATRPRAGSF